MSEILGIDVGYSHTKVVGKNGFDVFRSTVKKGVIDVNTSSTVIQYEGDKITIGERGRITVAANKISDPNFEPLLLTAILRNVPESSKNVKVELVTGLPIGWYKSQKEQLKDFLYNKEIIIGYKNTDRKIHIEDVIVFPQSAGLALTNPKDFEEGRTNLIIDIGGLTVDVSYYNGRKVEHLESYQLGMLKFYSAVASEINSLYNVSVSDQDVERFIDEGAVIINEEEKDFDFDTQFKDWMDRIITQIKMDFPYEIVHRKTWVGGGSIRFKDYLPNDRSLDCDKMYNNAEAFYNVGVQKFE